MTDMKGMTLHSVTRMESGTVETLAKGFVLTGGAILAITGFAKIWSACGVTKALTAADPIFGMQFRQLMVGVGVVEIAVASICFFSRRSLLATKLTAWLSTSFVVYRLGLWWMGWHGPCRCLGGLTDALHISPHLADNIVKVVLAYLLVGSYGLLWCHWRNGK